MQEHFNATSSVFMEANATLIKVLNAYREQTKSEGQSIYFNKESGEKRFSDSLPPFLNLAIQEAALSRRMLENYFNGEPMDKIQCREGDAELMQMVEADLISAMKKYPPEIIWHMLQSVRNEFNKLLSNCTRNA